MRPPPRWHHAAALLGYALLAVVHTWPLAAHLSTHLPGTHIGDNAAFAWNVWWMREALSRTDASFFRTDALFAPDGASLVLHTHTALGAFAAAWWPTDVVAATNLLAVACVALNGFAAYALAAYLTGGTWPGVLAGVLFLGAAPLTARLMGHFNLLYAWTMVCAIGLAVHACRQRSNGSAIAAGFAVGLVAWADYYLFLYTLVALLIVCLAANRSWIVETHRRGASRLRAWVARALVLVALIAFAVLLEGTYSSTNIFTGAWVLAIAWCLLTWRLHVRHVPVVPVVARNVAIAGAAACALVLTPLVWLAVELWWSGDYVAPPRFWRSAPAGADAVTFFLGPPWHGFVGEGVRRIYAARAIDPMEMSGWLGSVGPLLAILCLRLYRHERSVRTIGVVAVVFLVWSLGAFLYVAGTDTGLLLPQQFMRFVPIVSNARIPARALIVVALALSLLAAYWARERRTKVIAALCLIVLFEQLAAPLPLALVPRRGVDAVLASQPAGTAMEIPFGYRDGLGVYGAFDETSLLGQFTHRHPIAGGFLARVPARIHDRYRVVLTLRPCAAALADLRALRVRYIVARGSDDLEMWVKQMPLTRLGGDEARTVYELGDRCP